MESTEPLIRPRKRYFLPDILEINSWEDLKPYFDQLLDRELPDLDALQKWLRDWSELEAVISEDAAWRQIRMTCDTRNEDFEKAFTYYCLELEPKLKPLFFALNQKLLACPYKKELSPDPYFPFLRSVENAVSIYRAENVPIQAKMNVSAQQYGSIAGKMTIEMDGNEYTLQQAGRFLEDSDRELRERVFRLIAKRRVQDKDSLNELFDTLLAQRQQIAENAGFDNYRDYKFKELGRFDYTPEDCFAFHQAVKDHILPLHRLMVENRKKRLGLSVMRPWDTQAEPVGTEPLRPFSSGSELAEKSIDVFSRLNSFFPACIRTMADMGRLDLESRVGKAPGGYNCPLADTGVPFIFMNAVGTLGDVITMMHEGGHAFHSFLSHDLPLSSFKEYPMEMAELASMSMELFTMEHWDVFFDDPETLGRARMEEMERIISVLPWIATIDAYQHWLYTHPGHSVSERDQEWVRILKTYATGVVDWDGFEEYQTIYWQKQLHLFEVPFYYIEYGIAQVGAMAMWRQYIQHKDQALENYQSALRLGYTKPLDQLYETAGIRFDFSAEYLRELSEFVKTQLEKQGVDLAVRE